MCVIDIHNMKFSEATKYILSEVDKAYKSNQGELVVIHGYNHGTKIKEWIMNTDFGDKVTNVSPDLTNSGKTTIFLKLKNY